MRCGVSFLFLYGPPGAGKSSLGRQLAERLMMPLVDLDQEIEQAAGCLISDIFAREGEAVFRRIERGVLERVLGGTPAVVALGGGSLLDSASRDMVERAGRVLCLEADHATLEARLGRHAAERPLLKNNAEGLSGRLKQLLADREAHYRSFHCRLDVTHLPVEQALDEAQIRLGAFFVSGMGNGYALRVGQGCLENLGEVFRQHDWQGRVALVADANTAALYAKNVRQSLESAGLAVHDLTLGAGESFKTLASVQSLWEGFLAAGMERGDSVVALGGGVVSDMAGFSAATYMRGIRWVAVPTTLLSMVDAAVGGKTGFDLPQGKNLVGAFHPPSMVLADVDLLASLPDAVFRSGLAEVVKHGIINDPQLFSLCAQGWSAIRSGGMAELVSRAVAVKIRVVQQDPLEKGIRAALNFGHTVGHGIEKAMNYRLDHGEAVAIGLVAETRLSERAGIAEPGLAGKISAVLQKLGLPVACPAGMDRAAMLAAMAHDKKSAAGRLRFALPVRPGEVRTGVVLEMTPEEMLKEICP